jgi:hypothetical protein
MEQQGVTVLGDAPILIRQLKRRNCQQAALSEDRVSARGLGAVA